MTNFEQQNAHRSKLRSVCVLLFCYFAITYPSFNVKGCFAAKTPASVRQSCNICAVRTCGEVGTDRRSLDIPENFDIFTTGIVDSYIIACGQITIIPSQLHVISGGILNDRNHWLRHANLNIKGCLIAKAPVSVRQGRNICAVRTYGEIGADRRSLNIPENLDILAVGIIDTYIIARLQASQVSFTLFPAESLTIETTGLVTPI